MTEKSLPPTLFHLTRRSTNKKTGPIPVSTSSAATCPLSCPLNQVCYAKHGPLAIHWRRVTAGTRGETFDEFLDGIRALPDGQFWRHNEAGDLPGQGDHLDIEKLQDLVDANKGKNGFTYTHKPALNDPGNAAAIRDANANGFTINLSADSIAEADELVQLEIGPVAVVIDEQHERGFKTPAGNYVAICPNAQDQRITCEKCQLCQRPDRKSIIGFPVHGSGKKHFQREVA